MKKFTLFLVATLFSALSFAALNPYAYGLSSMLDGTTLKVNYSLNAPATAVSVVIMDGEEEIKTVTCDGITKGSHSVEISTIGLPTNKSLTWKVVVTGNSVASPTLHDESIRFYLPYGMDVDVDPESDYMGNWYVIEARNDAKGKAGKENYQSYNVGRALYAFDAALQPKKNKNGQYGFTGGVYLGASQATNSSTSSIVNLYRVVTSGGRVFIGRFEPNYAPIVEADPANLDADFTDVLAPGKRVSSIDARGRGENLQLIMLDTDGSITEYDLGNESTWADPTTPSRTFDLRDLSVLQDDPDADAPELDIVRNDASITYDLEGGIWLNQHRSSATATCPTIAHISSDNGFDYNNISGGIAHNNTNNSGIAVSPDGKKLAVVGAGSKKLTIYNISRVDGQIKLTQAHVITVSAGDNHTALAWDYAGNLFAANRSSERIRIFAMPYSGTVSTPCASKYAFEVEEVVANVYTLTTNVVGEGTVEGNAGSYVEGTTATLTATPAAHYDFVNWTVGESVVSEEATYSFDVTENVTVTANFVKKQYTLTVSVNDGTKGSVNLTSGTYEAEEEVEITATANTNYEFTGWSNGSKENPLTIAMEEDTELTANFRAILASSITLNAHPVKDYSASIVGTMKRAIQNGENTIVLTHEDNGTPHIYSIEHSTKTVTEISQVGVVAVDPDNAGDFLAISDIAMTEDGKLVACNYMMCQITDAYVDAGYKRGTSRFYIWDNLASNPRVWFTSQLTGNYYRASMGYTMALKGTSLDAEVTIPAFNKTNDNTRYSHLYVVDGTYTDASYKYSKENAALHPTTLGKNTYELNASPLAAGNWIVDGKLASPIEFVEKDAVAIDTYTALNTNVLGKKYNGASYLFHKDHHLMIAPYAADDKLAGVKVLGITDGFGSPVQVETNTALVNAIDATTAAATAYVDGDGDLTIYLFADSKVYTFSEKAYTAQTFTVTATAGEGGSVEGGGLYEESSTATVTATPNEYYDFVSWTEDGAVVSTTAEYSFTVTKDIELTANFKEHTKYTITASATDNTMGYVTGGGTYYAGETVTLKAVANSTYCFVNWSDGNTDATRTFTATADVTLTANFAKASSRAWAYDLKMVEDGDNYKFSFNATTAANATLLFLDKEGNELYVPHNMGAVAAGANTVSIEKAYFTQVKDVYWSVKMDGEAITSVAEITDQTRGIYDFYNMQDVLVDNDPNSEYFGKIYIEMAKSGTTNSKAQTLGLFLLNQNLDVLNDDPNKGILPAMPSGYALNGTNYTFQRLNIHPKTGDLVFSYGISSQPAVFAIDRENMTAEVTNLLNGVSGLTKTVAHCFDAKGTLFVMDLPSSGTIYKIVDGQAVKFAETTSKFVSSNITMESDGRGGLWVAQNRGQIDSYYQIVHYNNTGTIDYSVYDDQGTYKAAKDGNPGVLGTSSTGLTGSSTRGALAYDIERQILAQGRNGKVELYTVSYEPTITLTPLHTIASNDLGNNIDGLAFDYAGDLYVVNSSKEKFQKFALPTDENICTIPAPESQAIVKEIRYTVTVNTVGNGTATGAGEYVVGETATLEASPAANHQFVNWTYGSETSTDNPLSLVVEDNITVTANFEPVQYTLIAPTNDENKGTVTGAGTYAHGTEVTLTATPKAGYKLLYWSDRSTENPRTITMTKNEALSAYFVKVYDEEPTFSIEKVWENTQISGSADGYQAVGWDGNIYMQNKTAGKIKVYTNDTDAAVDYATSNISGQQIAVDEAGNLIVFNAYFASATPNAIQIYQKGSTTAKAINFTLPNPGRCDFLSASGDIYSAEGGYVYFYCNTQTVVNRVKITNGAVTASDVTIDVVGSNISTANSTSHIMVDIFGNLLAHARSNNNLYAINVLTDDSKLFVLPSHKYSTLGGCSFELGGKELWAYNVGTTNYNSEWNLYNMTDGEFLSNETLYAKDKVSKKTYGAANWLNVQVVDENTAYIYQFCPEVAVAVWKVSINRTDLQEYTVTATTNDASMGSVTGGGTYYEGATAILTATAKDGYRFINWTKDETILSTEASFTYTVPAENVTIVANFEALPTITYELNGGVWNQYGWTSKKDMYNALLDDWRAYSGSTRTNVTYEAQLGIGNSSKGIPTTVSSADDRVALWNLFTDATYVSKWGWLATYVDAVAATQYMKMVAANGVKTQPTSAAGVFTFTIGNFFGEDNAHAADYIDAVDFTGEEAHLTAFAPYWGQTFPLPTQPTEEIVLNAPYKEGYEFDGWYTTSDFSGAAVTTVDENTDGTLYAKWIESVITVTIDDGPNNTAALTPHDGETVTVNVNRNFGENKILTLTLPFDMSATQISTYFGNATIYEFYNVVDAGEELHLQFYRTTSIEAGKPYILQTTSGYDAVDGFTIEDVTITTALSPVEIDGITMVPVLDGDGELNQSTEYYLSNNALYCAGTYPQSLLGLRAYFTSPSPTPIRARVVFGENEATSIPMVTTPETKAQKIIQDGRLIIIRGEHQYNAQGQIIE